MIAMPWTRNLRGVIWGVGVATMSMALAGVWFAIVEPVRTGLPGAGGVGLAAFEAVVYTSIGALGATVTTRQPRNPIGWLLQLIPLVLAVSTVCNHVYFQALLTDGDVTGIASYAAWLVSWAWIFAIVPAFTVFPLLFPTGRPLSPPWRPLLWLALVAGALTWFGTAFHPGPLEDYPGVVNPFGIDSAVVGAIGLVGFGTLVPTALASIVSVVVRFRRSSGVERQQLKWVAAAAVLLPLAFSAAGFDSHGVDIGYIFLLSGLLIVAAAVAIAMLRYRLYDIDVVINRTLVYGALTATLAAAYIGAVLLLRVVFDPLIANSDLAVAGSTLAVAALFRPARSRIQRLVNHRFYRDRYDASRTLAAFSAGLRDQVDLDALGRELRVVVGSSMQPAHVSLWLRER